jgi:hypothetical protein
MAEYYQESPEITKDIDWDTILGRVPSTNIGMVPIGDVWDYTDPGVPQLGYGKNWFKRPGYVEPRDPIAADVLRYGPAFYDRPEELEFSDARDYDQPIPGSRGYGEGTAGTVYNTELNPFNPSSKFFPYEKDFSGIMSAKSLQEGGDPIYDISRMDPSKIPPSMRTDAEQIGRTDSRYGVKSHWGDAPTDLRVGLNVPKLEKNKGYIDSTLLHEARHYYQAKFGFDITQLSDDEMHNVIYQFQGMYDNPVDRRRVPYALTKKEADAYMGMHKQGKQWYQNQGQGFPPSKAEIKQKKQQESQARWDRREAYHGLMMAGQENLGQTVDQRLKQFDRMYGYDTSQRRGDYTRPTMTQQQMGREAQVTGGRVNPHEATRAVYQEQGPAGGPRRHYNEGGIAGLPGQWTPSMSESEEEEYNIRPLQLDPGIMSIEDLEALFEEAGLDKSLIYKFINSGGLSQLIS